MVNLATRKGRKKSPLKLTVYKRKRSWNKSKQILKVKKCLIWMMIVTNMVINDICYCWFWFFLFFIMSGSMIETSILVLNIELWVLMCKAHSLCSFGSHIFYWT
ncbi:hypothetical protein ABFS82_10G109300 [Erythranthe guttata]